MPVPMASAMTSVKNNPTCKGESDLDGTVWDASHVPRQSFRGPCISTAQIFVTSVFVIRRRLFFRTLLVKLSSAFH
jgi:hypothetical protein